MIAFCRKCDRDLRIHTIVAGTRVCPDPSIPDPPDDEPVSRWETSLDREEAEIRRLDRLDPRLL